MLRIVLYLSFLLSVFVLLSCSSAKDFCGDGTTAKDGRCIPSYAKKDCGDGTELKDGKCVPTYSKKECGADTVLKDGKCVPTFACGDNTELKDGKCVPTYAKITCGKGTKVDTGQCLPEKTLECAEGTREENGVCVAEDPRELCGPGRVRMGGKCITPKSLWMKLPFEEGFEVGISQGHHGSLSHKGNSVYSVDFPVPVGTKILAVRAGTVVGVRNDSDEGCGNASCGSKANYVYIDHGDGTIARYLHLKYQGTVVKVGEKVCQGQVIGYSGNTGFSTGPHLHLEIMNGLGLSLPIYFEELRSLSDGVAFPRLRVKSQNKTPTSCDQVELSKCSASLFSYRGVVLDKPFDCWGLERGKTYTLTGSIGHKMTGLAVQVQYPGGSWQRTCIKVSEDRKFSFQWSWPKDKPAGYGFFFLSAAYYSSATNCTGVSGWSSSLRIWANP